MSFIVEKPSVKYIYVVFKKNDPAWVHLEPLWDGLDAEYPNIKFVKYDGETPEGATFGKDRFVQKSPTIISSEGFRRVWTTSMTRADFSEIFLKQENVFR